MSNDSTATSPVPAPERSRGRRFRSQFCRFHAIGTVNRPPTYARSRRGRASATLSILTGEDRDLDLIVFDRDEATLRHRLYGLQAGARVYVEGTVQAPRLSQRELPQFLAEVIFHTGDHAPAPAAGVTAE